MSAWRTRSRTTPAPRPPSRNVDCTSCFDARSDGTRPNTTELTSATVTANASTARSTRVSPSLGIPSGAAATSTRMPRVREGEADRGAGETEDYAFGEQLPHDAAAARP